MSDDNLSDIGSDPGSTGADPGASSSSSSSSGAASGPARAVPDNLMLYDGVCNVCNTVVNFVIDRDPEARITFASLQSDYGHKILNEHRIPLDLNTMVFVSGGVAYTRSAAFLRLFWLLSFPWWLPGIMLIVPSVISDFFYNLFAQNRYKLFGRDEHRKTACRRMTRDMRRRFLDLDTAPIVEQGSAEDKLKALQQAENFKQEQEQAEKYKQEQEQAAATPTPPTKVNGKTKKTRR